MRVCVSHVPHGHLVLLLQQLGKQSLRAAVVSRRSYVHVHRMHAVKTVSLAKSITTDVIIAYGGGSAIGLGKAVALELHKPLVAIPTTYSGSEMTDIIG